MVLRLVEGERERERAAVVALIKSRSADAFALRDDSDCMAGAYVALEVVAASIERGEHRK